MLPIILLAFWSVGRTTAGEDTTKMVFRNTSSLLSHMDNNLTDYTLPGDVQCNSARFGFPLRQHSCLNAWGKMPRTTQESTYSVRSRTGSADITVPIRYQSDDGLCAIDLRPRFSDVMPGGDIARSIDISNAVVRILQECVHGLGNGGSTAKFSFHERLLVSVSKHESKAQCEPFPLTLVSAEACQLALESMPARKSGNSFIGPADQSTTKSIRLPKVFTDDDFIQPGCEIIVYRNPESGSSNENWFNIWAAGIDIYTMCIRTGNTGTVRNLGDNGQVLISAGGAPQHES